MLFILAASKLGFWGALLLKYGIPALIAFAFAYIPLMNVIKSLHKLIEDLIMANADKKINQDEYDQLCVDIGELKTNFGGLINGLMILFKKGK